ncbi:hypothetical protein AGMMS50230_02860 [Spirochaetia bacterium]|nr:hypothetical protein AGMMS50230_02860 [Spirochaetia bacterium]
MKTISRASKKTAPADVWAAIEKSQQQTEKAQRKTEKSLQELHKIIGHLGNRFGEFTEHTLVPDLVNKFKKYGFTFDKMSERVHITDHEHDLHAEIDAFLENGTDAMVVEVKVNLNPADVDDHIRRLEKVRAHADLHDDKRKFYGALAAAVIDDSVKTYALKQGFYLVTPSGESVKIVPPASKVKYW